MELPIIETFYKLNQRYNQNDLDDNNNSDNISEDNINNNIINSSNNIFLNKFYSTKFIPRIYKVLKLSNRLYKTKDNCYDNMETKNDDIDEDIITNKIKSNRDINLIKKNNKIKRILSKRNNDNLNNINKKIKIIKSSDNLYLNRNTKTNIHMNSNEINFNISNIDELTKLKKQKDEDKTILPITSKILEHKKIYTLDNHGMKDILKYRNEINKELTKKKTLDYKLDNKKYHEHYIFFNNCFFKKNSWNNNLLKNILPKNINYILKERELQKIAKINSQLSQEKEKNDKIKIKNKFNIFRNLSNSHDNSYSFFNSEINHFYNNYKNNNCKLILFKRNENINKDNNKIHFNKLHKNISYNYNLNIPHKKNQNNCNKKNALIKNISYDSMINVNSLFTMKNYN